jgi:hypothetical protein
MQRYGIDDAEYNILDAEWRDAHQGGAGTVEQLGTLVKAKAKEILIGKEPTRGVKIEHPGEQLPPGWTREFTEDGPQWTGPDGEIRTVSEGGPPAEIEGYHPGNVLPEDAAIARMFAQDSYRIAGAPDPFTGSGWSEIGGSGRALPRTKFHKYLKGAIEQIQYLENEFGEMTKYTDEQIAAIETDSAGITKAIQRAEREIGELREERADYPEYADLYDRDIAELKETIGVEAARFDDIRARKVYKANRADLAKVEAQIKEYEKHTPSDTLPEGQEVSQYFNERTGESMVSFRGNESTPRDYGAIASMAIGLEELNPRMRAAVQSVLEIADDPKYAGKPISLSGQSLGGATTLFVNEWLGINRPDVNIKKAYTYGAGSSTYGRAGVHWDAYYENHIGDASQWQQRARNYNIKGDAIAEQPTPYGVVEVYEPLPAGDMTSAPAWQEGHTLMDVAMKRSIKRHYIDNYPLEGGKWYSGIDAREPGFTNMPTRVSYYGEKPSVKLRVARQAIKQARPFAQTGGDSPVQPVTAWQQYQQSGSAQAFDDWQSAREDLVVDEAEQIEETLGVQPTGTTVEVTGESGQQYECSFNSPADCRPIPSSAPSTQSLQPSSTPAVGLPQLEILGFTMMPADLDTAFVLYDAARGVLVY